jgi:uncharacterized damage-inducible protein DinB
MDNFLRDLMAYMEWANAVFFHAWANAPCRNHEEIRQRVGHLVGVQQGFLSILKGEQPKGPPAGPPPTFDELIARAQTCHRDLRDFVENLDATALSHNVHVPWFPDPPCNISVGEALVQAAMHTQHHRGQLMTRLKDYGGEPKNVDWIIWLWKERPEARWN